MGIDESWNKAIGLEGLEPGVAEDSSRQITSVY